ncbi:MAG TPA: D-alanyl-D-alanine carboxypeptidase [Methylomirabilota bacterium]|nr:D-alanyl-D-alanine carboxypeptidase [Methylomirabilota bacterium]
MGRGAVGAALLATLMAVAGPAAAADSDRLHYLAVTDNGTVLAARHADRPVNPASVVKVGTTLWALDRLGPRHRWETALAWTGRWDRSSGVLHGDLVVVGGGDPDLQWENAFLLARELNRLGLRRVEGRLRVDGALWFGWEQGVEKRLLDPTARGLVMGRRLLDAFDPSSWTRSHANTWQALCARRGWDASRRPEVRVAGGIVVGGDGDATPLLVHRSNPLPTVMRRFNVYSNNDIVRVAEVLGSVADLEAFLTERLGVEPGGIELATASGERRNRMTVSHMVRLVEALRDEAATHGLGLADLLPVIGCDPGATRRMFPALSAAPLAGSVVCKTGTLTTTDGGVAVLAGVFTGADGGEVTFAVAAPRAGSHLQWWRQVEQRWLLSVADARGGAVARSCPPELPYSEAFAQVVPLLANGSALE